MKLVHGQQTDSVPTGQEYNRIRIFHYLKLSMAEYNNQLPDTSCPCQLFGIDLKTAIENGHQILLMEIFNLEYRDLTMLMLELGLIDINAKNMD